jgi:hypothetical protein
MNTKLMVKAAGKTVLGAAILAAALACGAAAQPLQEADSAQKGGMVKAYATFANSDENAEGQPVPVIQEGKPVAAESVRAVNVYKGGRPELLAEGAPAGRFAFEYEPKTGRAYPEGTGIGLPMAVNWKRHSGAIGEARLMPTDIPMVGGQNAAIVQGVPISVTVQVVEGSPKILKSRSEGAAEGAAESVDVAVMTFEVAGVGRPGLPAGVGRPARVSISSEGRGKILQGEAPRE